MSTHVMRWTALPAGEEDAHPRLSAHASFHLEPDSSGATLQDFPVALDWPQRDITFSVTFANGTNEETVPATLIAPDPRQPAWWSALFAPDLVVRGFEPEDRTGWKIRSFSSTRLAGYLQDVYSRLASDHPDAHPPLAALHDVQEMGFSVSDRQRDSLEADDTLDGMRETLLAAQQFVPDDPPPAMDPATVARWDLLAFRRFYDRRYEPDPPDTGADPDDRQDRVGWIRPPQLDFHQVVTACFGHATLLRPLGLVFDLVADISMAELTRRIGRPELVRVVGVPSSPPDDAWTNRPSPWTRCDPPWTPGFYADHRPGDSELVTRFLHLGDSKRFEPSLFDLESGAHRAMSLGDTLQLVLDGKRKTRSTPSTEPAASLRATGIGINRRGRAERFHNGVFQRAKELQDATDGTEVLYANDVLRGYRVDVRHPGDEWRSLMRRQGTIHLGEGAAQVDVGVDDDEAWSGEIPVGDNEPEQIYLHEEVLRWNGWSLGAPKPGAAIDPEDKLGADGDTSEPLPGVPLVAAYRAQPGTLPVLRYGRAYDIRARAVDIAANGEPLQSAGPDAAAIGPLFFGRFNPVPSPDVLLTEPRKPGEHGNLVVLRSHHWDQDPVAGEELAARHILPPRGAVTEAERHGALDGSDGRPDPGLYPVLAERDAFSLNQLGVPDPDDPTDDASGSAEGTSRYYPMATFDMEYLPDPLAKHLELRYHDKDNPNDGKKLLDTPMPFATGSWPDFRALRLEVREGTFDVGFDDATGVLDVRLAKAEVLRLRASCRFEPKDLDRFGLAAWLAAHLGIVDPGTGALNPQPDQFEELRQTTQGEHAVSGNHWMFTPWRDLIIVHAVKQPLLAPRMRDPNYSRTRNSTNHTVAFRCDWSHRSTRRLDLRATWEEGIDNGPGTPPPRKQTVETVAVPDIRRHEPPEPQDPFEEDGIDFAYYNPEHEFGDTKYRRLRYRVEATSTFVEHFLETKTVTLQNDEAVVTADDLAATTVVVRSIPSGDDDPITYRRDDGDGGDFIVSGNRIERTPGSAIGPGDEVRITFATAPVSRLGDWTDEYDMPCSTRPNAPVIRSVLPTFRWEKTDNENSVISERVPAGVRVWLERPWWSSGLGEKLAVVLTTDGEAPDDDMDRFVTQWGRDPIHASGLVGAPSAGQFPAGPAPEHFPLGTETTDELTVPGTPSSFQTVRAVAHEVLFDEDRDLWYCDIDINAGGYWPFVRLALARWQPHALTVNPSTPSSRRLELSPTVLADIVQVAPGRYAAVARQGTGRASQLTISVNGPSYAATHRTVDEEGEEQTLSVPVDVAPEMLAFVERRPNTATGDLGWEEIGNRTTLSVPLTRHNWKQRYSWQGSIKISLLVTDPNPETYEYRLVLEERERYRTDGSPLDKQPTSAFPEPPYPTPGRRVVYTDIIPVTTMVLG